MDGAPPSHRTEKDGSRNEKKLGLFASLNSNGYCQPRLKCNGLVFFLFRWNEGISFVLKSDYATHAGLGGAAANEASELNMEKVGVN